jgi:hypothetical protein
MPALVYHYRAVGENILDAGRMLMLILEGGTIDDPVGVEYDNVRTVTFAQCPTVTKVKPGCRQGCHLAHRIFQP